MRRSIAFLLFFSLLTAPADGQPSQGTAADNGLFVAEPKLFDDYALEQMLIQAERSLGALEVIQSAAITSAVGRLQGAQVTQTQFALSAAQLPTPSVVEVESATPSTQTTTGSVTPAPATPQSPPQFTLPSSFGPSGIDTIEEMLQVQLQLANLRLLLRGSLTDQVSLIGNEMVARSSFTFGFPITITTPSDRLYRDAVAEVEVRVTLDPNCAPQGRPALKMVLPREKTYNVAQIKSNTTSIGTGVVAGVFNLGANWIRGQSTYFLVQDQDTISYEGASDDGRQIVFGWRFKPVLGQRKVQSGPRQVFAQLTFPVPPGAAALGQAEVTTRWRKLQRKTGALGEVIPGTQSPVRSFQLKMLDQEPGRLLVNLLDLGNGKVRIALQPGAVFFEGTTFRLGGSTTPPVAVVRPTDRLELDTSPIDVVRQGLFVGVRGQRERLVLNSCADPGLVAALPVSTGQVRSVDELDERLKAIPANCEALPSVVSAKHVVDHIKSKLQQDPDSSIPAAICDERFADFTIRGVKLTSVGQSTTRVQLTLDKLQPRVEGDLGLLTIVGDRVYGLRDSPYEEYNTGSGVIEFLTDTSVLEKATEIEIVRLLWGPAFHASWELDRTPKLAVAKHTIVSDNGGLWIAIEGQGLDRATIRFPVEAALHDAMPGHATVFVPKSALAGLKRLVLEDKDRSVPPVLIDISKASPEAAKPIVKALEPIRIGTEVELVIAWENSGEIKAVLHDGTPQTVIKNDKNSATVRLANALTARPGKIGLVVEFKDGTKLPLNLQIVDQRIAVVQE